MQSYCEEYKKFLDAGKTERECVDRGDPSGGGPGL